MQRCHLHYHGPGTHPTYSVDTWGCLSQVKRPKREAADIYVVALQICESACIFTSVSSIRFYNNNRCLGTATALPLLKILTLTLWSRGLLEKLIVAQLIEKFCAVYGIRIFITVFITDRPMFLSWITYSQSTPSHYISLRCTLILFSPLRLGHTNVLFPSAFPARTLYACLSSPTYVVHIPSISSFSSCDRCTNI
jgi:hypothetical protein